MNKHPPIEIGDQFGKWTVIADAGRVQSGNSKVHKYLCRCECGTERLVAQSNLVRGESKSCGLCGRTPGAWSDSEENKWLKYPPIEIGDRFGKWTVIEDVGYGLIGGQKFRLYRCRCECGTERIIPRNSLVRGLSKSCGLCGRDPDPWIEAEEDHYRYYCSDGGTFIFSPCDLDLAQSGVWLTGLQGYAVDKQQRHFSRLVLNAGKNEYVDHISMDITDNRRENLRLCTWSENNCNKVLQSNNTSGYKGVTFHKLSGKYMASLWKDGQHYYGGLHSTAEEAAKAYDEIARKVHGEFARLNFPGPNERSCRQGA